MQPFLASFCNLQGLIDERVQQQGRRQGGLRGLQPPLTKKKREEKEGRRRERKKKEKREIKRERKLNQSFQEHVFMGL